MAKEISLAEKLAKFWYDFDYYGFKDDFDDMETAVATFEEVLNVAPYAIIKELRDEMEDNVDSTQTELIAEMKSLINEIERYENENINRKGRKENGKK